MLKYITQYNKLLSTNDKLNEFLLKIFRSIYRLRMVAFPGQCNDKLDPIRTIERIEKRLQLCIEGKWGKLKDHPRAQFMNDESLLD